MSSRHLQTLIALVLAGLWGCGVYFGHTFGHLQFLDRAKSAMTDLRTLVRGVRVPPDLLTIVAIDDAAVKLAGGYPLARIDLARVVDAIARLEPKVIAVDLLLVDKGADDGDEALAKSLARHPIAIAAAAVFSNASQSVSAENDEGQFARLPRAEKFLLPLKKFADHAQIGIVNVATDRSGTPRSIPMLFRTGDRIEMSFPLRVAALAVGKEPTIESNRLILDERSIPADVDHALPITFYGPRETIRTVSAASVLAGETAPDAIRNRIVVVGATVPGGGDFFPTPFEPVMPGVEVISTAIAHLMAGDGVLRDRSVRIADGITAVVLPGVLVGLLAWGRSAVGLVAAAAVVLIWAAAIFLRLSSGILLSAAVQVAAAGHRQILFGAVQLWLGRRRAPSFAMRSELLQAISSSGLEDWLSRDPIFLLNPCAQSRRLSLSICPGLRLIVSSSDRTGTRLLKDFLPYSQTGGQLRWNITSFLGDGDKVLIRLPELAR